MSLVSWARRLVGRASPERRYGPAFDALAVGRGWENSPVAAGVNVGPRSALTMSAYFAAINVVATDLACLPIKVYRRKRSGGRDEVSDDRRADLLATSPDGETTSMRFRQALHAHMLGNGNGYAEIGFSGGEVEGFYWLDPSTEPARRSQDKRLYYRLPDGTTRPPYKVLHFAGLGFDGLCGYSVARLMRQAIGLGLAAETFGSSFFGNGTQTSGFFEMPHKMTDDAVKTWRAEVNRMHQSAANAWKFMVLEGGMKWNPSTIPPEDAQFLATRQFQVLEIARAFRLPPHKIGDYSQSHLSNIEESNIDYMTTTLMPWCESIEQELNRKLFTAEERARGFYCEHQMQAFLRGNMGARSAFYEKMFGLGVYTPNDIARYENLNPIGPDGDERFLTVQAKPFKTVLSPPPPPPPPAPPPSAPPAAGGNAADGESAPPPPPARSRRRVPVGSNGHACAARAGLRFNPNHGADGKFAGGGGGLAAHAPATTPTGSKLVVEEGEPETAADRKHMEAAEARGKTAIKAEDRPNLKQLRNEESTRTYVGGKLNSRVEAASGEDQYGGKWSGWKATYYDKTGEISQVQEHDTRKRADKAVLTEAKKAQQYDSATIRVATKDPEGFVSKGENAHQLIYGQALGGYRNNPTDQHWTTTYRVMRPARAGTDEDRFNPYHGKDGKFTSKGGHGVAVGGKVPPKEGGKGDDKPGGGAKPADEPTKPAPTPAKPEAPKPAPAPAAPPAKDLGEASTKDVKSYHDSMSADAVGRMSVKEKGAIQGYSSSLYQEVNGLHRTGTVAAGHKKADLDSLSKSLDSAIDKGSLKEPLKVYRGVGDVAALGIKPGAVIHDKGYLSTSLTPKVAAGFGKQKGGAVLEITAPKGAKGVSVSGMTNRKGENEVLFARNSQMKITGMRVEKGRTIYTAELQ